MEPLIPLLIAVPLLAAALLAALNRLIARRWADAIAVSTSTAVTVMALFLLSASASHSITYWFGEWLPRHSIAIGIAFVVDPFSGALSAFCSLLMTAALVVSWHYFESIGNLFHVLMLIFLAALNGFFLTGDLFTLFVFFELMSVAAYALTAYKIEESSLEGALNFAVSNTVGGYLLLFGLGLLYGRTGALNLAQMGETLARQPLDGLVIVAFVLVLFGLFTKAAIVPFHFWLDDAHAVAPTPVCIIFSGIMVESALYAAARIFWTVFSGAMMPHLPDVRAILVAAAVATSILGAMLCYAQRHIKRMLAFSTISHSGLILAGIALLSGKALAGAGIYILGHGMVKAALFICAGMLLHSTASVDEIKLKGKAGYMKWTAVLTIVGALGLADIPPFGTFAGKALIDESAKRIAGEWLPVVLSLTAALTAATVLRMAGKVFFDLGPDDEELESRGTGGEEEPETRQRRHHRVPLVMIVPAAVLLLLSLVFAYLPGFGSGAVAWADIFQNRPAYAGSVLRAAPETLHRAAAAVKPTADSYAQAALSFVVAVVIAAASLGRERFPRFLRDVWSKSSRPMERGLRFVHSGYVGDYVTWQTIGLAAYGVAFALAMR